MLTLSFAEVPTLLTDSEAQPVNNKEPVRPIASTRDTKCFIFSSFLDVKFVYFVHSYIGLFLLYKQNNEKSKSQIIFVNKDLLIAFANL